MKQEILQLIDVLGTVSFAISGAFAAMKKKLDILGIFIIAFITAIGGGTVRDVLIGDLPVNWMRGLNYPVIIVSATLAAIIFRHAIKNFEKTLLLFDSLGLGFFTVIGIQKGLAFGLHPAICVALGMITGSFGGVIRDVLLGSIPTIFRSEAEIYATASIAGGILYFALRALDVQNDIVDIITISVIFLIRMAAVRYKLTLPAIPLKQEEKKE